MLVSYEPWSVKNEKLDQWGFKIIEGKFNGTLVSITSVELEDNSDQLKIDFGLVEKTKDLDNHEFDSKEFNSVMENIINDILSKALNEYKNRDNNTTESS